MFFQNFNDTEQFTIASVVITLCVAEFSAAENDRSVFLSYDRPQLVFTSVCMDVKCLIEVWVRQWCFLSHDFF